MSPRDTSPFAGHLDPEVIGLLSLGETPGTADDFIGAQRHLETCETCRSEIERFSAIATSARAITPADVLVPPPDSVWTAISAELQESAPPSVTVLERRRRTPWLSVAAAACVGILIGGAATYAATSSQRNPAVTASPAPSVLAETTLRPLQGTNARGSVEVVSTASGPQVVVDVSGLKAAPGYYEVWLLDRKGDKLVALGALNGADKGTFAMPPGVSMSDYPVVDVSLEPPDGNPEHSHNSFVRGTLPA